MQPGKSGRPQPSGDAAIDVRAFGTPDVLVDGRSVAHDLPAKSIALVVYLADSSGSVSRSTLAGLLWSDSTEERARNSLRVALTRSRSVLKDAIVSDRSTLEFTPSTFDVDLRNTNDPLEHPELYVARFLDSFEPSGAALFAAWAETRRHELATQGILEISQQMDDARQRADWSDVHDLGSLLLAMDPWSERAHRAMIESLAQSVGRSAALAHYDEFARSLESELGVEPELETRELAAAVRERSGRRVPDHGVAPPGSRIPFFGRNAELHLLDRLATTGRPVSIVGPGGIGKSRLLVEYAARRERRGDDVIYVAFDGDDVDLPRDPAWTVAEGVLGALGDAADSRSSPVDSLHRSLAERAGVLCLDDVDSLGDVSHVVADLARRCPDLEIVVATRRRLAVARGCVIALEGLRSAMEDDQPGPAVQLFIEATRDLGATVADRATIVAICRRLGGHPLAIELAAHLARSDPLQDVLERIGETSDLAVRGSDMIDRHRSIRDLVRASTCDLSGPASLLLGRLTSFAGAFTKADVDAVSADADHLHELVDHSLVHFDGHDYRVHAGTRAPDRSLRARPSAA